MIQAVVITLIGLGAGWALMDNDQPPTPPPAPIVSPSFQPLASALYWVGGCSVTCSAIWAGCLIHTANLKRRTTHELYR